MKRFVKTTLKWIFLVLILMTPFYLCSVFITGPLALNEITSQNKLDQLYQKTAFSQCELLDQQSIQDQLDLARCTVLDREVWLLLDNDQNIKARLNMSSLDLNDARNRLLSQYRAEQFLFSYYQDQFVYHVSSRFEEYFITIEDERVSLRVKLSHE